MASLAGEPIAGRLYGYDWGKTLRRMTRKVGFGSICLDQHFSSPSSENGKMIPGLGFHRGNEEEGRALCMHWVVLLCCPPRSSQHELEYSWNILECIQNAI
jgi:hypothetical protein